MLRRPGGADRPSGRVFWGSLSDHLGQDPTVTVTGLCGRRARCVAEGEVETADDLEVIVALLEAAADPARCEIGQ
jgi:hypothetical protein